MRTSGAEYFRIIKSEMWTFEGRDALRFLNGISTPHLTRTGSLQGPLCGRGLFLDPKGKLLAPFVYLKHSDTKLQLRLDIGPHSSERSAAELNQSLGDHISALIIADDVTLSRHMVEVVQAWDKSKSFAPLEAPKSEAQDMVYSAIVEEENSWLLPTPHLGAGAFELWSTGIQSTQSWAAFGGHQMSFEELSEKLFSQKYLEFPAQLKVGDLPLEFGFADAISFFKGCYRGQEIIARVTFRGKLVKGLCELSFHSHLHVGDTQIVNDEGQIVGEIRAINMDANRALAVLRFDAGQKLCSGQDKVLVKSVERLVKEVNEQFRG